VRAKCIQSWGNQTNREGISFELHHVTAKERGSGSGRGEGLCITRRVGTVFLGFGVGVGVAPFHKGVEEPRG